MKNQRSFALLLPLVLLAACSTALPAKKSDEVLDKAVEGAEAAALTAEQAAKDARVEREKSERLLMEARSMLTRAEAAQQRCQELVKRIPKYRPAPVAKKVEPAGATDAAAATAPTANQGSQPAAANSASPNSAVGSPVVSAPITPPAPSKDYSPSDAPLTPAEIEALKKRQKK